MTESKYGKNPNLKRGGGLRRPKLRTRWSGGVVFFSYGLILILFLYNCLPVYSLANKLLACLLIVIGTLPLVEHIRHFRKGVPLIEIPLATYPLLFSLPLCYQAEQAVYATILTPSHKGITLTLIAVNLGVIFLYLGYRFALRFKEKSILPKYKFDLSVTTLLRIAFLLIGLNLVLSVVRVPIPEGAARIVGILISADLGLAILGVLYHQKKLTHFYNIMTWACIAVLVLRGLATGMTQAAIQPVFVFVLTGWIIRGKPPILGGVIVLIVFFLLQPVKMKYRDIVWRGQKNFTPIEKVSLYVTLFNQHWFGGGFGKGDIQKSVKKSANERLSLLLTTQRYIELTPKKIDYKKGESIGYVIYGWIPRVIWPSKPIAQLGNRLYPVEYGLQHPRTVSSASFGVGHIGEGYINFGFLGLPFLFFALGFLSALPKLLVSVNKGDPAGLAIQCFASVNLMFVGGAIGGVYGGLWTAVLAQVLMIKFLGKSEK